MTRRTFIQTLEHYREHYPIQLERLSHCSKIQPDRIENIALQRIADRGRIGIIFAELLLGLMPCLPLNYSHMV